MAAIDVEVNHEILKSQSPSDMITTNANSTDSGANNDQVGTNDVAETTSGQQLRSLWVLIIIN